MGTEVGTAVRLEGADLRAGQASCTPGREVSVDPAQTDAAHRLNCKLNELLNWDVSQHFLSS